MYMFSKLNKVLLVLKKLLCLWLLLLLLLFFPRPHYSAWPMHFGSRDQSEKVSVSCPLAMASPKWIDREGLGKRCTGTRQLSPLKKLAPATKDTSGKSKELRKLHLKGTSSGDVVASYIQLLLTMDTRKGSVKVQPFYKKMFYLIISATGSL